MGTRCAINFCYGSRVEGKIYRHWDGYPDGKGGVLADLLLLWLTALLVAKVRDRQQSIWSSERLSAIVENANDAIIGRELDGTIKIGRAHV